MSSMGKREFFNNRERAISNDFNRLSAFIRSDVADTLKFWLLTQLFDTGGLGFLPSAITNPLTAMIINGFLVVPQVAGVSLTIDPGVMVMMRPDATPDADDSKAKIVVDPGQQTLGVLTLTPNPGVGRRIDVVECAVYGEDGLGAGSGEVTIESDNRDIYNTGTGLFAPALVNKVVGLRLVFRIRTGAPGAGFPGTASGWLPLMVASVPVGAATWDDVTCWDVRPLINDLVRPGFNVSKALPSRDNNRAYVGQTSATLHDRYITGHLESSFGPWRAGGSLPVGGVNISTPTSATNEYFDGLGYVGVDNAYVYAYAAFPFGLPRWCRYVLSGAHAPGGFNGFLILSQTAPSGDEGAPSSNISPSTAFEFGIGAYTTDATMLCPLIGSAGLFGGKPAYVMAATIEKDWVYTERNGAGKINATSLSAVNNQAVFDLVDQTDIPACAKRVKFHYFFNLKLLGVPVNNEYHCAEFSMKGFGTPDSPTPDCFKTTYGGLSFYPGSGLIQKATLYGDVEIDFPTYYRTSEIGPRSFYVKMRQAIHGAASSSISTNVDWGVMATTDLQIVPAAFQF